MSETNTDEVRRLRRTMRDLVALSTLPAVWGGLAVEGIAQSLASVLLKALGLDLVYIRLAQTEGAGVVEAARSKHRSSVDKNLPEIRAALSPLLAETVFSAVTSLKDPFGGEGIRTTITRFGLIQDHGVLVAGCSRANFPTDQDRLLLGFAANQVAVISQKRHAERALRQSEQRFLEFADTAPAMLWATEPNGSRSFLSHGWVEFTGRSQEDGLLFGWIDVVHPEHRQKARERFSFAHQEKEAFAIEYLLRRADGEYRWVFDTGRPRISESGQFLGFVGNILDITDRKKAESEQERLLRAVETERQRLADVFQQSPSFMCVLSGPAHIFERANDQYLRLVGHREILGRPVSEALPEVVEQGFVRLLDTVYRTGEPYIGKEVPVQLHLAPESLPVEHYLDFVYQPLRGPDGEIAGIFVQGIDLTERKRAEVARKRDADQRSLLLDVARRILEAPVKDAGLAAHVFRMIGPHLDADICFSYELHADGSLRKIVGIEGMSEAPLAPERIEAGKAFCGKVTTTRQPIAANVQRIAADLTADFERELGIRAYSCHPLLGRDGQVLGTFSVASTTRDSFSASEVEFLQTVSDFLALAWNRHKAEAALSRLYEEVRQQDRRKDEFLATLAHELRNPLAPVRTGLTLLNLATSVEQTVKTREIMERQVGHMVRLIDDLMEVSRITTGKVQLKKERVELRTVFNTALELSRPLIEEGRHGLFVSVPKESFWLDADPTRIAQILGNLLNNAAKYTPDGGRIELSAERDGGDVVIRVRDNGLGLQPDAFPRIFELFTQVGKSLDRSQAGLGIGLALVKRLVEMHGGSVSGESRGIGHGCTFVVRLPVAAIEEKTQRSTPLRIARPASAISRILVVDDNEDAAELLAMLLIAAGHRVETVHNGPEALRKADIFRPDVVFLDIGLPGMSGYEAAQKFRASEHLKSITLVALTGWGAEDDRKKAKDAGFDHHLTKPVESESVHALLNTILSGASDNERLA